MIRELFYSAAFCTSFGGVAVAQDTSPPLSEALALHLSVNKNSLRKLETAEDISSSHSLSMSRDTSYPPLPATSYQPEEFDAEHYIRGQITQLRYIDDAWLANNDTRLILEGLGLRSDTQKDGWRRGLYIQWNEDSFIEQTVRDLPKTKSSDAAVGVMFSRNFD